MPVLPCFKAYDAAQLKKPHLNCPQAACRSRARDWELLLQVDLEKNLSSIFWNKMHLLGESSRNINKLEVWLMADTLTFTKADLQMCRYYSVFTVEAFTPSLHARNTPMSLIVIEKYFYFPWLLWCQLSVTSGPGSWKKNSERILPYFRFSKGHARQHFLGFLRVVYKFTYTSMRNVLLLPSHLKSDLDHVKLRNMSNWSLEHSL